MTQDRERVNKERVKRRAAIRNGKRILLRIQQEIGIGQVAVYVFPMSSITLYVSPALATKRGSGRSDGPDPTTSGEYAPRGGSLVAPADQNSWLRKDCAETAIGSR